MRNVPLARSLFENGTENAYIPKDLVFDGKGSCAGAIPATQLKPFTGGSGRALTQAPLSEQAFLETLINLCDDLAWGPPRQ